MHYCSKQAVQEIQRLGKVCVLDIEIQGVKQIKRTDLNPFYVFIKPPSIVELERRLKARNTETKESLEHRLSIARSELEYGMLYMIRNLYEFMRARTHTTEKLRSKLKL